jgi:serine phosphatase RsbU (regulator of sigma subunit)
MALMLLKFKNNRVLFSSAGMPPVLIYRSKDNIIKDIINQFVDYGETWRNERPQNDDITFVLIKILSNKND